MPKNTKRKVASPPERQIEKLVRGRVIDYSGATPYFKKLADGAVVAFGPLAQREGDCRYRLDSRLFASFRLGLPSHHHVFQSARNPADVVARAFWSMAWDQVVPDWPSRVPWPPQRTSAEPREDAPQQYGGSLVYEYLPEGKLRKAIPPFEYPQIRVSYGGKNVGLHLPKLTIEFEGDPLAVVNDAFGELRPERSASRIKARKLIESLFIEVLKMMRLKSPSRNRPREDEFGQKAAQMHDLKGWTWKEVAERLCEGHKKHKQTEENCKHRMKQAAARWYRLQVPRKHPPQN